MATPLGPLATAAASPNIGGSHLFPVQTSTPHSKRRRTLSNTTVQTADSPSGEEFFRCSVDGCRFYSSTQPGLLVHMTRKHPPNEPDGKYACHVCPRRFVKGKHLFLLKYNKWQVFYIVVVILGFLLSRHLITKHNYQRPAGHFKFNYVVCEDGLHRLQTLRLDTVEVASAILGPETVGEVLPNSSNNGGNQVEANTETAQVVPLENL